MAQQQNRTVRAEVASLSFKQRPASLNSRVPEP